MTYAVLLLGSAQRDARKLAKPVLAKLALALTEIAQEPRGLPSKKLKAAKGLYRWRVGDHRILYEIDDEKKRVLVHRIVDRKDAY